MIALLVATLISAGQLKPPAVEPQPYFCAPSAEILQSLRSKFNEYVIGTAKFTDDVDILIAKSDNSWTFLLWDKKTDKACPFMAGIDLDIGEKL